MECIQIYCKFVNVHLIIAWIVFVQFLASRMEKTIRFWMANVGFVLNFGATILFMVKWFQSNRMSSIKKQMNGILLSDLDDYSNVFWENTRSEVWKYIK